MSNNINTIKINKVFLDLKNPRHLPYKSEQEVIEYLCTNEQIYELAKDIVLYGLNPLENFAVIKDDQTDTYIMVEGNRRLCAIKLLNDPLLAPKDFQNKFREISKNWQSIDEISAALLDSTENVDLWLTRIHGGQQQGIGRRQWNAEQKTRHFGDSKNVLAQMLLDFAEEKNLITTNSRKGKISTVQRFTTNQDFKDFINIGNANIDNIKPDRLKIFIDDLVEGKIDTRTHSTTESVTLYVKEKLETINIHINQEPNTPNTYDDNNISRNDEETTKNSSINQNTDNSLANQPTKDTNNKEELKLKPKPPTKLTNCKELTRCLADADNYKLQKIYQSLHEISVKNHAIIITVGIWSFLETLTYLHGRQNGEFSSYCNNKFRDLGFHSKEDKAIKEAIQRFHECGNTTKHHPTSAMFNTEQIINDFKVIEPFLIAMVKDYIKKSNSES